MRFVLVDEILELAPGQSIVASKTLSSAEDIFKDHFPGFPVVPGVLLTEMMAQAAGKCLDAERNPRGKAMLARINSANFRAWVKPDETAVIRAVVKTNTDRYATADCSVEVNDRKVSTADLLFTFVPMENFAAGYRDEVLESYLSGS